MSLLLNTGAMHYRENANEEWKPLVIKADVDLESLADPYSTLSTYSVGEYCTHDGKFNRCKTPISTAEAWNSSHWEEVSVGQELESVNQELESINYVRPNLLDNWYFAGGGSQLGYGVFPINQRGQTSYGGVGYTIDRWKNSNSQVTTNIASNGLSLSTSASSGSTEMVQFLNRKIPAGTKVTLSAIVSQTENVTDTTTGIMRLKGTNGFVYLQLGFDLVSFSQKLYTITDIVPEEIAGFVFRMPNNGSLIVHACKLELGDTQTLAHQENGAWVLNEVPDFGEQLAKCQRHFVRLNPGAWHNYGYVVPSGETAGTAIIALPQVMVANPNVALSGNILAKNAVTNTTASGTLSQNTVTFNITSTGMTLFSLLPLRNGGDGGHIDFSAES